MAQTPAKKPASMPDEEIMAVPMTKEMKELVMLLAKRAKLNPEKVINTHLHLWINANSDLLTSAEKETYKQLVI